MALSRAEMAVTLNTLVPQIFTPNPMANKPTPPDISGLSALEQSTINNWMAAVDVGGDYSTPPAQNIDGSALSAGAQTAIGNYSTYFASSNYLSWRSQNFAQREGQWRLMVVDAIITLDKAATLSVSQDPSGAGSNAIGAIANTPTQQAICSCADFTAAVGSTPITAGPNAVTVPTGNSGKLKLNLTTTATGGNAMQYQIAAGAWTNFVSGTIITLTNGQNLGIRMNASIVGKTTTGTIVDNDTGVAIANVSLTRL